MGVFTLNKWIFGFCMMLGFCFTTNAQCTFGLLGNPSPLNCITNTGSATVTPVGGTGPYTYSWIPFGGTGSVATNLPPGTYTINSTDANNCVATTQVIIISGTNLTVFLNPTHVTCNGYNDGQLFTNVNGGSGPYTYVYNPPAANSSSLTNLNPGSYSVTVTDMNGCSKLATAVITQPSSLTVNTTTIPITCSGGASGVTVSVSGATAPYTYSWTPISSTSSVIANINPGNYSVTVTDSKGCKVQKAINIVDPAAMSAVISSTNITCNGFGNGKASVNVSGGSPGYTYTWTPTNNNNPSVNNLLPGNYTVTIKDSQGCLKFQTITITQPAALSYNTATTPEFCISSDGSASITVNGGIGPYTYSWTSSPPQTNSVAVNLPAGNYSVFVTDANGCKTQTAVTVANITNMSPGISSKVNVACYASCSGSATASISGGTGPYSFLWPGLGSATTSAVTNLCQGTYSVKITDANGCYTYTSVTILEPLPISSTVSGISTLCTGQSATLTAALSGGTPGYTVNWLPANLTGTFVVVSPSISTTYSLIITDANGCGASRLFNVNVNPPLSINVGSSSQSVCPNVNTSITVVASGGDGNYFYTWAPGNYTTSAITVNLPSSSVFTVTVTDGCGSVPVTNSVNIGVYPAVAPSFTVTTDKGCEPLCIQFTNTTPSVTSVVWNLGDFGGQYITPAVTHCFEKPGLFDIYIVTTDQHGCKSSLVKNDFITVYGKPKADFIFSPESVTLNNPDVQLKNSSVNAQQFYWTMDGNYLSVNTNVNLSFYETGCHVINLYAANESFCSDSTTKTLCVREGFNFWMPNAFTPDEDTRNDFLKPKGTDWSESDYLFEVYNRWGTRVYKTTDITGSWDGNYNGSSAADEVYVWKVFVRDVYGFEHEFLGKVNLIR